MSSFKLTESKNYIVELPTDKQPEWDYIQEQFEVNSVVLSDETNGVKTRVLKDKVEFLEGRVERTKEYLNPNDNVEGYHIIKSITFKAIKNG